MDLEQRLRAGLVAPDPGATFTARVMARVGRGASRRPLSLIVIGAVVVTGAAAAMLAWQMSAAWQSPVASQLPAGEGMAEAAAPAPESFVPLPVAEVMPKPGSNVVTLATQAPRTTAAPGFSVQLLPLQHQPREGAGRAEVDVFYNALIDELRRIPGLDLRFADTSGNQDAALADYVITVSRPAVSNLPDGAGNYTWVEISAESGQSALRGSSPGDTSSPRTLTMVGGQPAVSTAIGPDVVDLNIIPSNLLKRMDAVTSGASTTYGSGAMAGVTSLTLNNRLNGFNVDMDYNEGPATARGGTATRIGDTASKVWRLQLIASGAAAGVDCTGSRARLRAECMSPAMHAAAQVELLRLQVFPPDAEFQRSAIARLPDVIADQPDTSKPLLDLLQGLMADGGSRLDAATIEALAGYAARQPAGPRLMVWRMLGQSSHPALIAPLLQSLRHDRDAQVRLAALASLEAGFPSDPQVRSALEAISRAESDELVRTATRRAYYREAQWREDILAGVRNTALPYEVRLAPLVAHDMPLSRVQMDYRLAALADPQILRPVIELIESQLQAYSSEGNSGEVIGLLGNIEDPAVTDLLLRVIRETPALRQETMSRGDAISMSGPVTSWVFRHRSDPRVLDALAASNPEVRTLFDRAPAPVAPAMR